MSSICSDLAAEHAALDSVLAPLGPDNWERATPAPGWSIRDQVGHLTFFDRAARLAASDPEGFQAEAAAMASGGDAVMERTLGHARSLAASELLPEWRRERAVMLEAFAPLDPKARIPWYGPPMSALSFATARLMETWAHGQDVVDTLGAARPATSRLRHVAHIGVRARPYSYAAHGKDVPAGDVRVELRGPDGDVWTWGQDGVPDWVSGDALDFCLVVTQRRHSADTDLVVEGPLAAEWIAIAQAFAGPPGEGRQPGQFRKLL